MESRPSQKLRYCKWSHIWFETQIRNNLYIRQILRIHNDDNNSAGPEAEKIKEGEYHVEIELKRAKISDDTKVECLVKIPGSDYVGKDSKTYNGENWNQMPNI